MKRGHNGQSGMARGGREREWVSCQTIREGWEVYANVFDAHSKGVFCVLLSVGVDWRGGMSIVCERVCESDLYRPFCPGF